jgi:hypothetical protein
VATLLGGVVLACGMRVWNDYHPGVCAISTGVAALPVTPIDSALFWIERRPASEVRRRNSSAGAVHCGRSDKRGGL